MEQTEIQRKDEEIIRQFRKKNRNLPEQKESGVGFAYIASSFVVLALLAMGITVVSNYDKMKEMEVSINRLEVTAQADQDDYVEAMATTEGVLATGMDAQNITTQEQVTVDTTLTETTMTETAITSQEELTTQTQAVLSDNTVSSEEYYIIQEGDSLSSIAFVFYGDADHAKDIAIANDISVDDNIFVGQKIVIPNLQ